MGLVATQSGQRVRRLVIYPDVYFLTGLGAPTNGTSGTGAGNAGPGSMYFRTSNGATYINTNTKASPTWSVQGTTTADNVTLDTGGAGASLEVAPGGITTTQLAASTIQYVKQALTNAQVKAFHTTPVQVIATPGGGKYLVVHHALVTFKYGGTNALTGGGAVSLVDHGGHVNVLGGSVAAATFTGTATVATMLPPDATATGLARPANTAVDVEAATADFAGNAANDNTATVEAWYSVGTP